VHVLVLGGTEFVGPFVVRELCAGRGRVRLIARNCTERDSGLR
jgi:uncharacterized protein YbjT (DUF2867 family)